MVISRFYFTPRIIFFSPPPTLYRPYTAPFRRKIQLHSDIKLHHSSRAHVIAGAATIQPSTPIPRRDPPKTIITHRNPLLVDTTERYAIKKDSQCLYGNYDGLSRLRPHPGIPLGIKVEKLRKCNNVPDPITRIILI